MKIKTNKKMTPEEYAKYMIDKHGIRGYESELIENNIIDAPKIFLQKFELNPTSKEDLLTGSFRNGEVTVEVEEEITEDTVFPSLVVVREQRFASGNSTVHVTKINNKSVNGLIGILPINSTFEYKEIYLMDDDKLGQCIWRDGKMVE